VASPSAQVPSDIELLRPHSQTLLIPSDVGVTSGDQFPVIKDVEDVEDGNGKCIEAVLLTSKSSVGRTMLD
jgi:hypothetical protein